MSVRQDAAEDVDVHVSFASRRRCFKFKFYKTRSEIRGIFLSFYVKVFHSLNAD